MSTQEWRSVLDEEEKALQACAKSKGYVVPNDLTDEDTCKPYFDKFCEDAKLKVQTGRQIQLSNKFFHSCLDIIDISEKISTYASDLREEDKGRPQSLIWKTSHTALEVSTLAFDIAFSDHLSDWTPTRGGP